MVDKSMLPFTSTELYFTFYFEITIGSQEVEKQYSKILGTLYPISPNGHFL